MTDVLFVYNPRASNYKRSVKWLEALAPHMGPSPQRVDFVQESAEFDRMVKAVASGTTNRVLLIAIAGGDGTVSAVANRLTNMLSEVDAKAAERIWLLPLWGGNANDMACMLNGLSSTTAAASLAKRSRPVAVPLIRITMTAPGGHRTTRYACCYASFGASAYAARQLDSRGFAKRRIIQYLPPVVVVRELAVVLKTLASAPAWRARLGEGDETSLYEHTLVNGPRLAKVNRVPVGLTDPLFFHAVVTRKHPSVLFELIRIVTGRSSTMSATRSQHRFTVHDDIAAQVDGEVLNLEAGTEVVAEVVWPPFRWWASKLN